MGPLTLEAFLQSSPSTGQGDHVLRTVMALADAAAKTSEDIRGGADEFARERGTVNASGEAQRQLDLHADEIFLEAMRSAPVRCALSEERPTPTALNPEASVAVAIDPLDGSSNIGCNALIGTIFSMLPANGPHDTDPSRFFLQPGVSQLAAGIFLYGPQLTLMLTLGHGAHGFVFSPQQGAFVRSVENLRIADHTNELAINAANYGHWDAGVQLYIDDCLKGERGPRKKDFYMRWIASVAAEAHRILLRGGAYLYPGDARPAYRKGRLRLVYEANPIAFLIEQAGGIASDGANRILDLQPEDLHQRTPLIFGSAAEVERIGRYHVGPSTIAERSPLFGSRGLFRT